MKTKHIIILLTSLFWLTIQFTQAQTDYTVYQFQNRANGKYLSVADDNGSVTLLEKTKENNLNQYFILKRIDNGKVLIAAAQNFNLFLKNDGTFAEIAGGITNDFEWRIELVASSLGAANDQVYTMLFAVNKGDTPVLGSQAANDAIQFYNYPTDIYNDANERICFSMSSSTKIF